jgi:hypothetical protein
MGLARHEESKYIMILPGISPIISKVVQKFSVKMQNYRCFRDNGVLFHVLVNHISDPDA